jgi:hypothetical protein
MSGRKVTLTIDRLVLRGVDPLDQRALVDGLQTELARVLADPATQAALGTSRRTPVLRLGRMPLAPGLAGAREFGGGLARASVTRAIGGEGKP